MGELSSAEAKEQLREERARFFIEKGIGVDVTLWMVQGGVLCEQSCRRRGRVVVVRGTERG